MQKIGRYEVVEELGHGAMGVVYRALDTQIGRIVAIKVIRTANASPVEIERYKQRFQREAQAAGRMSHPGIVTIHDIAEDEQGQPYLVMEFVEGTPLDRMAGYPLQKLPFVQVLDIGIQVAQALDYAHRNGVVHRDIKPANILVTPEGRAKIADFGIAKMAGPDLTQEGHSVGTPSFMSPEQFRGSGVDARSDLFSFGAVLYWMATGEKPFTGDSVAVVSFKIAYEEPPPARGINPVLPEAFETILSRCLAKNPEHRYNSCADLAADLTELRSGGAVRTEPAPSSTLEKTMPFPLPSARARQADPAEETTSLLPAAGEGKGRDSAKLAGARRRTGRAIAAVAFLAVMMVAGYSKWQRRSTIQSPADEPAAGTVKAPAVVSVTPAATPAAKSPDATSNSGAKARSAAPAAPAAKASAKSDAKKSAAPSAMLIITCTHNFKSATLEIFSDGQPLLEAALEGKSGMFSYKGTFDGAKPIPSGEHTLRVHVSTADKKFDGQAEISGAFAANGSRKLVIEFGRGSGIGMAERRLTLSWK